MTSLQRPPLTLLVYRLLMQMLRGYMAGMAPDVISSSEVFLKRSKQALLSTELKLWVKHCFVLARPRHLGDSC